MENSMESSMEKSITSKNGNLNSNDYYSRHVPMGEFIILSKRLNRIKIPLPIPETVEEIIRYNLS